MKRAITIIKDIPYKFDNFLTQGDFEYGIQILFGEDVKIKWRDNNKAIHISNINATMFVTDEIK